MRLIDADELTEKAWRHVLATREDIAQMIANAPTVAAVPLEDYKSMESTVNKLTQALADAVKHGHWTYERFTNTNGGSYSVVWCSNCQAHMPWVTKYCPNCGAKMDEVEE